jgi:hypothetical protein
MLHQHRSLTLSVFPENPTETSHGREWFFRERTVHSFQLNLSPVLTIIETNQVPRENLDLPQRRTGSFFVIFPIQEQIFKRPSQTDLTITDDVLNPFN